MIKGIGNLVLSTFSQTFHGQDPLVTFGEPLVHIAQSFFVLFSDFFFVVTLPPHPLLDLTLPCADSVRIRVQIQYASVCRFKTPACIRETRHHVKT